MRWITEGAGYLVINLMFTCKSLYIYVKKKKKPHNCLDTGHLRILLFWQLQICLVNVIRHGENEKLARITTSEKNYLFFNPHGIFLIIERQ